jgi:hypothetical protein
MAISVVLRTYKTRSQVGPGRRRRPCTAAQLTVASSQRTADRCEKECDCSTTTRATMQPAPGSPFRPRPDSASNQPSARCGPAAPPSSRRTAETAGTRRRRARRATGRAPAVVGFDDLHQFDPCLVPC